MGRKKIEIDWKFVDEKLANFWEGTEIAAHIGVHFNTLSNAVKDEFNCDFCDYKAQKRAKGEAVLREIQLQTALDGNVTMQIWLGKQYLGQNDKTVVKHEGEINLNDARQRLIKKLTEKKEK